MRPSRDKWNRHSALSYFRFFCLVCALGIISFAAARPMSLLRALRRRVLQGETLVCKMKRLSLIRSFCMLRSLSFCAFRRRILSSHFDIFLCSPDLKSLFSPNHFHWIQNVPYASMYWSLKGFSNFAAYKGLDKRFLLVSAKQFRGQFLLQQVFPYLKIWSSLLLKCEIVLWNRKIVFFRSLL